MKASGIYYIKCSMLILQNVYLDLKDLKKKKHKAK